MGHRDHERAARLAAELEEAGLDALVCAFPSDVLLVSGYWPVVGTAVAVVRRDGTVAVAAPEDEREAAERGRAEWVRSFRPGTLDDLRGSLEAVRQPLEDCARRLGIQGGCIGWEEGAGFVPVSYVALHHYGAGLGHLLRELLPRAHLKPAGPVLARLRAVTTARERERIAIACREAEGAYREAVSVARAGTTEAELAAALRARLSISGLALSGVARADGFAFCMSGPNSARAHGSHAGSSARRLEPGDLVLIHCNSYVDGLWTDITRTYVLGPPDDRRRELYHAVLDAREAALAAIRPGVRAAAVDAAARSELARRGLGAAFKHSTGHGVGFAAIDHQARPRLHPVSPDVLAPGMVFNVEPAVYLDDVGGIRHCDMVAVTGDGAELLTPFHAGLDELVLGG